MQPDGAGRRLARGLEAGVVGWGALPSVWPAPPPRSEGAPPLPQHPAPLPEGQPGPCLRQHSWHLLRGPLAAPGHGTPERTQGGHPLHPIPSITAPRSRHRDHPHGLVSPHLKLEFGRAPPPPGPPGTLCPACPPRVDPQRQSPACVPSAARASRGDPQAGPPFPGQAPTSGHPVPLFCWGFSSSHGAQGSSSEHGGVWTLGGPLRRGL